MIITIYAAMAPGIPIAALFIAACSLIISLRSRAEQREALLLAKKTELLTKIAQRQAKIGHLIMVCAQKLILLKARYGASHESEERQRLENNLNVNVEAQKQGNKLTSNIENTYPKDLRAFETMLATANQFLEFVKGELEKEQVGLKDLQDEISAR